MKRVTWRDGRGAWGLRGADLSALPPAVYGALCKLKDLEDLLERAAAPGPDPNGDRQLAREELDRMAGGGLYACSETTL